MNRTVLRARTCKLMLSADKQLYTERSMAYHLRQLKRAFLNGDIDGNCVENADKTHFVFSINNCKALGFVGDSQVRYADLVSGGWSITVMVRKTERQRAAAQAPMLVFKNMPHSYQLCGVPDSVLGLLYLSSPKAWMDGAIWSDWLQEPRALSPLPNRKQRVKCVDSCSLHMTTPDVLESLRKTRIKRCMLPCKCN